MVQPWHLESLNWLAYLSMVFGSLLCAALLANEAFEAICAWYLNRVSFLGDASADPRDGELDELVYSSSALAHVNPKMLNTEAMDSQSSTLRTTNYSPSVFGRHKERSTSLSKSGSYVVTLFDSDKEVNSKDTKLFYHVNLLRFRESMQRIAPSDRPSCVHHRPMKSTRFRVCASIRVAGFLWAGFRHLCDKFSEHSDLMSEPAQVACLSLLLECLV